MNINGSTGIVGIFGSPIEHTLSPAMHNAAFAALKLNYAYVPFRVEPPMLPSAVEAIRSLNLRGVNITVPHKEAVLPLLDRIDPLARKIGSVNTVVNRKGKLSGHNTDAEGFIRDITGQGFSPRSASILILGAGGAAKAMAHALAAAGTKTLFITDLVPARGRRLAHLVPRCRFLVAADVPQTAAKADLIINATPLGMHAGDPSPLDARCLRRDMFVYDVVYNRETKLLQDARRAGATTSGGLGMLLLQGAAAFELWTGVKAPVAVMKKVLAASLSGR